MNRCSVCRPLVPLSTLAIALAMMTALALVDANLKAAKSSDAAAIGTPGATPSAEAATPVAGNEATVSIDEFVFDPPLLEIGPGTTVTWTNLGGIPHIVTERDGRFDSGNLFPKETYAHTFAALGTFDYDCRYHPGMTGTIVVIE